MLNGLIRFSLTQRMVVIAGALLVGVLGALSWREIPLDAFPDISPTQVKVILKVPGMTAEEIEQAVTYPLETELLGIPRKTILRSTTKYAITDVTIDFEEGVDVYWARQQVNERLTALRDVLPEATSGGLAPLSTPLSEMFMFTVEHPSLDLRERRELLDWVIRPALRTVEGVADVNVLGGQVRSLQITPDPDKLSQFQIQTEQIRDALARSNRNTGVGRLEQGSDALIVRVEGRIESIEDLRRLPVEEHNGRVVTLEDVAEVSTHHMTRYGAVTRDGQETTQGLVVALRGANTGAVVARVKARLQSIASGLPQGTNINVFYDRAQLIDEAVGTMSLALLQSVLLVIGLLALFLGNLRAAAVVSLSLPMAALGTFLLMRVTSLTANLMSLGGLVIAIGLLVDASVVVVENVLARLNEGSALPRLHVVYRAATEVAKPVVAGTTIVVLVFAPLLTLQGLEGKLFAPVALTIVFAMLVALAFAMVVVPLLAGLMSRGLDASPPRFMVRLRGLYATSLTAVLHKPAVLLAICAGLLVVTTLISGALGRTFMPVMDEGDIIVQLEKSPSISLAASVAIDEQVERAMLERVPEIRQVVARTGSDELGLDPMSLNETDVFMQLAPADDWRRGGKAALVNAIRDVVEDFPGMSYGFTQPIQMRVSEMLTGSTGDVTVKVFGDQLDVLSLLVDQVAGILETLDGAVDIQKSLAESDAFLNLRLRPALSTAVDVRTNELAGALAPVFEGEQVSTLREGRKRIPVMLGMRPADRPGSNAGLGGFRMQGMDYRVHTVGSIADLSEAPGPVLIEREQGSRYAAVSLNVQGRDLAGFVAEAQSVLAERLVLLPGYRLEFGGEFENQQRAMNRLLVLVPIVLLLIVAILFATFRSLPLSLLVLLNVPFALVGGVAGLFVASEYLSVPASVGFIALLGIAVLNAVVMLSYFEQQRVRGGSISSLIVSGATQRLRPILMTATTAMFGLVPLVFASGPGAEIQRPLAIVVIGGLLTSTLATLYLLPVFYQAYEARRQ